jgi:polar amino acid transport system substrate-binding protein
LTGFRTIAVAAICSCLLLAVLPFTAGAQDSEGGAARRLTFAADEWCPVNCDPNSDRPGYMVEIVKAILEPEGYEVRYVTVNWARALLLTRSGRFDGVFGALVGDAPDFVFPSEPQGGMEVGLFVRRSSDWSYTSELSLQDRRVGLIRGYAYGDELEALIAERAVASYAGGDRPLELNMLQLRAERIDIVVEDVNIFRHTARELGLQKEFRLAKTFSSEDIYAAFSPGLPDAARLAELLSRGTARLRASGELDKIMARYGLED